MVRRAVEARYAAWLDEQFARAGSGGDGVDGDDFGAGGDGGGAGGRGGEGGVEGGAAAGHPGGGADAADSLGLAALMGRAGKGGAARPGAAEEAADALQQHIKIFLLFGVLVRPRPPRARGPTLHPPPLSRASKARLALASAAASSTVRNLAAISPRQVRHLQRFSLRTCHAWTKIPPEAQLVGKCRLPCPRTPPHLPAACLERLRPL